MAVTMTVAVARAVVVLVALAVEVVVAVVRAVSRAVVVAVARAVVGAVQQVQQSTKGWQQLQLQQLGRERDTLAADVILWQGRAVAAKAEQDLLLLGGTGGRLTSCPRPNQRFASNMLRT